MLARHSVGAREHQPTNQLLERPPFLYEANGEVVEKLRMARTIAVHAEIVHGSDEARAEQVVPDSIHQNASRQRIVRVREPARQLTPPTDSILNLLITTSRNGAEEASRDGLAE